MLCKGSSFSLPSVLFCVRISLDLRRMAKTAIISDIHANYHALSAVIEDVRAMQCTDLVCLGDVVGYNAYPSECLDYVRELKCPVVKGNHDEEVVTPSKARMNPVARQAMDWTRGQLDAPRLRWLSLLQYQRIVRTDVGKTFSIVHSSLNHPKAWNYIINASDASNNFPRQFSQMCFHGHTHVPKIFVWDGKHAEEDHDNLHPLYLNGYTEFQPLPNHKYFINVGSVGQPRDSDPRACYGIFDTDLNLVIIKRVEYDIRAAQDAIRAANLPDYLAERLEKGI